jgi:hypothetical protein
MFCDDREQLVAVRHPEVLPFYFFAHTNDKDGRTVKSLETRDTV